jgi:cytochrome b561
MEKHQKERYTRTLRILHWVSAAVILWATITGLYAAFNDIDDQLLQKLLHFNVSLTFVFIPIFMYRALYRMFLFSERENVSRIGTVSYLCHILMYVTVSVVLFSGVFMMDHNFSIFGLVELQPLLSDPKMTEFFEALHIVACRFLALIVALHILAVLFHCLLGRCVLHRML